MAGYHEARLRATVAGVHDADVLSEMAVGWRTAITRVKSSENHLERVRAGLEAREQLGPRTRSAAAASLTAMADHLRLQRRVLAGTAQALDDASAAMSRAVRLVEGWDRAGAPLDPGPAPQPDPLAKPGDDQSAHLAALSAHSTRMTAYNEAVAQREDAARREMDNLQETFASAEDKIRVHHDIPDTWLTKEQHNQARLRELALQRQLEDQRRAVEARRRLEERLRLEELEGQRLLERERLREHLGERGPERGIGSTRHPPGGPGHLPTLPAVSHHPISHLEGSSSPATITAVAGEAQSGIALSGSASATSGQAPLAASAGAPGGWSAHHGLAGTSAASGGLGGTAASISAGSSARAAGAGFAPSVAAGAARADGTGGAGLGTGGGGSGRARGGAGSRAAAGAGRARGRGGDARARDTAAGHEVQTAGSEWLGDDQTAPGVLG